MIRHIVFSSDGYQLIGTLHMPAHPRPPVVIGSHGLFSSSDSPKQKALAEACNRSNIAFFRFDHRGCGASEGRFEQATSFQGRCRDLQAAIKLWRHDRRTADAVGLFGSSLGGAVCLAAAADGHKGPLVTFAAPVHSDIVHAAVLSGTDLPAAEGAALRRRLHFDLRDRLERLENILVFHGSDDAVVPVAHARQLFEAARQPKELILQKNGDHRMSRARHQQSFVNRCVQWFDSAWHTAT